MSKNMKSKEPKFKYKDGFYSIQSRNFSVYKPLHEYLLKNSKIKIEKCNIFICKGNYTNFIIGEHFEKGSIINNCFIKYSKSFNKIL